MVNYYVSSDDNPQPSTGCIGLNARAGINGASYGPDAFPGCNTAQQLRTLVRGSGTAGIAPAVSGNVTTSLGRRRLCGEKRFYAFHHCPSSFREHLFQSLRWRKKLQHKDFRITAVRSAK